MPFLKGFHFQSRHPAKFILVAGDDAEAVGKAGGGNPHIIGADELSSGCKGAIDFAVVPGDFRRPRQNRIRMAEQFPVATVGGGLSAGEFASYRKRDEKRIGRSCARRKEWARPGTPRRASRWREMTKQVSRIRPKGCRGQDRAERLPRPIASSPR